MSVALALAAAVVLFLLVRFPRAILTVLGLVALLIVGGIALIIYNDQARSAERKAVVIEIHAFSNRCSPEFPLQVTIRNGSKRTLEKVAWHIAAYRPGYSTDLARSANVINDKIIGPKEEFQFCYILPNIVDELDKKMLEYRAEKIFPYFSG